MFSTKKTVASITAGFHKMVAELEKHVESMEFDIAGHKEEIIKAELAIEEKNTERTQALVAASKLRALIGD